MEPEGKKRETPVDGIAVPASEPEEREARLLWWFSAVACLRHCAALLSEIAQTRGTVMDARSGEVATGVHRTRRASKYRN